MLRDIRGLTLSTADAEALQDLERAIGELLRYSGNPIGAADAALARDPGFVMAHAFKAAVAVLSSEASLVGMLRDAVQAGEANASRATERERAHVAAARAWLEGDLERAVEGYGRIVLEWPRDVVALQAAHLGDFYLGQPHMLRDRVGAALHAWDDRVPGYPYVLGMHAFGLEETGEFARAEEAGRRAVELEPRDGWAAHAVMHVMEMQARLSDGPAWIDAASRGWDADNGFALHNFWHQALMRLDTGDTAAALALYDRKIRPGRSQVVLEMIDASALLWRLHLAGAPLGARAAELADDWKVRTGEAYYSFNDVHAAMAFVAAGRLEDAEEVVRSLEASAAGGGTNAAMARDVGLPIARALLAFGRGRFDACLDALLPARSVAIRFGGSNAQRDVLSLTLLEAALRGGRAGLARSIASERVRARPASPPAWMATARALEAQGDAAQAAQAREQATRLVARALARAA
jgi:tetratricopeptide (TPR) repeat protein